MRAKASLLAWYWADLVRQTSFPIGTEHPQVETTIHGTRVWCDLKMVPILKRVNRYKGVATLCSCQGNRKHFPGDREAYLFCAVDNVDVIQKLIKRFGKRPSLIRQHKGFTDKTAVTWRWKNTDELEAWARETFGLEI